MIYKHATRILLPPDVHKVLSAFRPANSDGILVTLLVDGSKAQLAWYVATQNASTPLSNYSMGMSFCLSIHTDNENDDGEDEDEDEELNHKIMMKKEPNGI